MSLQAYNLPDLLDIILDNNQALCLKLVDIGNGRLSTLSQSKYKVKKVKLRQDQITRISENIFVCKSKTNPDKFYTVDMSSGDCECKAGSSRAPCSHKNAIAKFYKVAEFAVVPDMSAKSRALYHYL